MTPEVRAKTWYDTHRFTGRANFTLRDLVSVAEAISAAVAEEREACAREATPTRCPEQIAAAIRART
jgi:hypothetical protein